jgi:hypothetical protein
MSFLVPAVKSPSMQEIIEQIGMEKLKEGMKREELDRRGVDRVGETERFDDSQTAAQDARTHNNDQPHIDKLKHVEDMMELNLQQKFGPDQENQYSRTRSET